MHDCETLSLWEFVMTREEISYKTAQRLGTQHHTCVQTKAQKQVHRCARMHTRTHMKAFFMDQLYG